MGLGGRGANVTREVATQENDKYGEQPNRTNRGFRFKCVGTVAPTILFFLLEYTCYILFLSS